MNLVERIVRHKLIGMTIVGPNHEIFNVIDIKILNSYMDEPRLFVRGKDTVWFGEDIINLEGVLGV